MAFLNARTIMYAGACLTLILPLGIYGQTVADLAPGSRISVSLNDSLRKRPAVASGHSVTGQLVRSTPDSLYVEVRGAAPFGIARGQIRQVWLSRGVSRKRSALEQGAFAVPVAALVLGPLHSYDLDRQQRVGVSVLSVGIMMLYGALRPDERWQRLRK